MSAHKLKTTWHVQQMGTARRRIRTESIHSSEAAGRKGLDTAKRKYPLSTWLLVKQEEIEWWPR